MSAFLPTLTNTLLPLSNGSKEEMRPLGGEGGGAGIGRGNCWYFRLVSPKRIHSIEKNVVVWNYKPLMMRPNRFMGKCISSFDYSKNTTFRLVADASCTWQSKRCKPTWRLYSSNSYRDETFGKFRTVKRSDWALLVPFRLACTVSIDTCNSHQAQDEQRTVLYLNMQMIIYIYP